MKPLNSSITVSILIINYKTCELTLQAIRSVYRSVTDHTYEVILVDNDSRDETPDRVRQEFPDVKVIENAENVGFAKANNQAMELAAGRYILLLNSDTVVRPDTLSIMVDYMEAHPEAGAAGCKVILPDGSLDKACKRGFPTPAASFYYAVGFSKLFPKVPRFNQYQLGYLSPDQTYPVDCLVGAFMLVRREAVEQVGGLDERFFMYGEDIDWCYRIKEAGWQIYYHPGTHIIHYKGGSNRRKRYKIVYEFHRAMILFHRKHYRSRYPWLVNQLVYAGVGVKFLLSVVRNAMLRARGGKE